MKNTIPSLPFQAVEKIKSLYPELQARVGIIAGSGLGNFADLLEDAVFIDYEALPGFPALTVSGHVNRMVIGRLGNTEVVCLQGRAHSYEGINQEVVKTCIRTLKLLGCEYFLATNA